MIKNSILAILTVFMIFQLNNAFAESGTTCSTIHKDIEVKSELASASFFPNARNSKGSIRYESAALLKMADEGLKKLDKPNDLCSSNCQLDQHPEIVFKSIPNKFLMNYSGEDQCNSLLKKTTDNPLLFNAHLSSLDQVDNWFADFSQGKGSDGQKLYDECPGSCSPQYSLIIGDESGNIILKADVICGPARDKHDDKYVLSYSYRWYCEEKSK